MAAIGGMAELVDIARGSMLAAYGDAIAGGVAYGVVLSMRHPEYAQAIYRRLVEIGEGEFEESALLLIVDKVVREMPLERSAEVG